MKRLVRTLTFSILCTTATAHAQAPASQPSDATPTLRSSARIVVVDVVVTDKNHNPVHHLPKSEFTLLERKVPQVIQSFEEHTALSPTEAVKFEPMPTMPPGIFTNFTATPVNSALDIILLDTLNTPMQDQAFVRSQIVDYLKKSRPGTRVAIFGLGVKLVLLQGFTSDPETLKQAMTSRRPNGSPLLDDPVGGVPSESTADKLMDSAMPTSAEVVANVANFEAIQKSVQLQLRAKYTLDALNNLARYLTGLPGRKNLIWFSGSFPINILPDADLKDIGGNPFAGVASAEDEFRETTNLLARSQVAVYPIDARGLMTSPTFSVTTSAGGKYVRNPAAFGRDQTAFFSQTASENSTMQRMADDTGGQASYNNNGLSQAIDRAIENGSNYYTLTYTPTNTDWNGGYRDIRVALERSGYTLAYRRGYYADDPDAAHSKRTPDAPNTATPRPGNLQAAMTHGAPNSGQILFKVRVLPTASGTEGSVAPGNKPNPDRNIAKPPFRRFSVDFAADAHMVKFSPTAQNTYQGAVDWVVYVYDINGQLINFSSNTTQANLDADVYKGFLRTGIPYHQEISVPDSGSYYLRIGLQDLLTGNIGAVEIPVAAVKIMAPIASSAPPAAAAH